MSDVTRPSTSHQLLVEILSLKHYNLTRVAGELTISRRALQAVLDHQTEDLHIRNFSKLLGLHCLLFAVRPTKEPIKGPPAANASGRVARRSPARTRSSQTASALPRKPREPVVQ